MATKTEPLEQLAMCCSVCRNPLFFADTYWLCDQSNQHGGLITTYQIYTKLTVECGMEPVQAFATINARIKALGLKRMCDPNCRAIPCKACGECARRRKAAIPKRAWLPKKNKEKRKTCKPVRK